MANALLIEHLLQVNWEINCVLKPGTIHIFNNSAGKISFALSMVAPSKVV